MKCKAKLILCVPATAALAQRSAKHAAALAAFGGGGFETKVVCFGDIGGGEGEGVFLIDSLPELDGADPDLAPEPYVAEDPKEETVAIYWTSGTTGMVKKNEEKTFLHTICC